MDDYIMASADRIEAASSVVDPREFAHQLVEDGMASEDVWLALCAAQMLMSWE